MNSSGHQVQVNIWIFLSFSFKFYLFRFEIYILKFFRVLLVDGYRVVRLQSLVKPKPNSRSPGSQGARRHLLLRRSWKSFHVFRKRHFLPSTESRFLKFPLLIDRSWSRNLNLYHNINSQRLKPLVALRFQNTPITPPTLSAFEIC